MFDTGAKEWKTYDAWPPKILKTRFYLGNKLSTTQVEELLRSKPVHILKVLGGYLKDCSAFRCTSSLYAI
jgi:hypothetical protein